MKLFNKALIASGILALSLTGCSATTESPVENEPTSTSQFTKNTSNPEDGNNSDNPVEPTKTTKPTKPTTKPTKPTTKDEKKKTPEPKKGTKENNALSAISSLKVSDEGYSGYKRAMFGASWSDVDNNGCDTRNDVLSFHMESVKTSDGCKVVSGKLYDTYTLQTTNFVADRSGGGIDIDHVVALSNGWKSGLAKSSDETRLKFANDPLNLLPVDAGYNRTKGDKDTSEWIPSSMLKLGGNKFKPSVDCPYVARQVAIKKNYKLSITSAERKAMEAVLSVCPSEPLPTSGKIVKSERPSEGDLTVKIQNAKNSTTKKSPVKKNSEPKLNSKPKTSNTTVDPDMGTCTKAKSAGYGPYTSNDPEYQFYQDRDKDGVVCE